MLAEFLGFRIHFGANSGRTQELGDPLVITQTGHVEHQHQDRCGGGRFGKQVQHFHGREQAVQAKRSTDAGERLLRIATGQVVVSPAGTDAAKLRLVKQERFVHGAGVIIETPTNREIYFKPILGNARGGKHADHLP